MGRIKLIVNLEAPLLCHIFLDSANKNSILHRYKISTCRLKQMVHIFKVSMERN